MPRKRMDEFVIGPEAEEAQKLAAKVFGLQERLGISNEQMAQETGLNKTQIYNLRNAWFYKKRNFKRMYPSLANALVEFWNSHLFNDSRAKSAFKRVYKSKPASQEMAMCAVAILVAKVGMAKTEKLLTKRGKSAIFTQFLESLSPEQLADMV